MADSTQEGVTDVDVRSPLCVSTDDEDPPGCIKIVAVIPGMKIKSSITGKKKLSNGDISVSFDERSFNVDVKLKTKNANGKVEDQHFAHKILRLPDDILPKECTYKIKKEQVILTLKKAKQRSWTRELSDSGLETFTDDCIENN